MQLWLGVMLCPDSSARMEFTRRTSQSTEMIICVSLVDECHGIGCWGKGGTPQMAVAQGGSGGVGIKELLPWVLAEPPVMHTPLYVVRSGKGVVNPSVKV